MTMTNKLKVIEQDRAAVQLSLEQIDDINFEIGFTRAVIDAVYHMAHAEAFDLNDATETMSYLSSEGIIRLDKITKILNSKG